MFQGRYKALLVDIDEYAQELSRDIHLNPVKAGIVEKPEQYKWSSYQDYINVNKSSKWLCTEFILSLFSRKTSVARKQYRMFVESMVDVEYESPLKNVFASTILGDRSFINQIREKHLDRKRLDRDLPDLKQFNEMPDLAEIIKQAGKVLSEEAPLLKRVQIYLCHRFSGKKLKDIGLQFGIGVSGVSQASRRVALQIKDDKKLKKKIDKIISELSLSTV